MIEKMQKLPYALITGACSGIGLAYSKYLAILGYNIVMVSNQPQKLSDESKNIKNIANIEVVTIEADLSKLDAAGKLYNSTQNMGIEVDFLVNNAGIFCLCDFMNLSEEKIDLFLNLHTKCVTNLCKLYGDDMRKRGKGYIINMSSISAYTPLPAISMYQSTKAYINIFSQSLRLELKGSGVNVTSVCPAGVATKLYSLPPKLQKLGLNLGILITPEKMVKKAVRGVYKNRRKVVPGIANRLFPTLINIMPDWLISNINCCIEKWKTEE